MNFILAGKLQSNKWKLKLENEIFCTFGRQFCLLIQQTLPGASKKTLPNVTCYPPYHVAKYILQFLVQAGTCVEISW